MERVNSIFPWIFYWDKLISIGRKDAYKTLSHPSRRIDYDVKLKMYRRGDFKKKTDEVKRQRDGAFLKLEKQQNPEAENKETLLDKAKGLEKEFYAEAKEQPR